MRSYSSVLSALLWTSLSFSALAHAQYPWSSILTSSRANPIGWGTTGLPATLPDGETTPNPWTPPTRAQCGSTVNPSGLTNGTDTTNINNALAACTSGHYVLLGSGTFNIENAGNCFGGGVTCIQFYAVNGVTLRGSGAQSTKLKLTGDTQVAFGIAWNAEKCSWSAGYSVGTSSITLKSCTINPVVGELLSLRQCDTGFSGSPCSGSTSDNGGLYVCGAMTGCSQQQRSDTDENQTQVVYISAISGTCTNSCAVTISPGLYAPNWSSGQSPVATWTTTSSAGNTPNPYGDALEDLTVDATGSTNNDAIDLDLAYGSWLKGLRIIGYAAQDAINVGPASHCLIFNNYLFADAIASGSDAVFVQMGGTSDTLMLNNIVTGGQTWNGTGGNEGNVIAYNYGRDSQTSYYQLATYDHEPGDIFALFEANQSGLWLGDNTWGTQDLSTVFRGYYSGTDTRYASAPNPRVITVNNYVRFDNFIGNILGGSQITSYQTTSGYNFVYQFGTTDPLALSSTMRWGNYDNVTGAVRWCGNSSSPGWANCSSTSEVPTSLTGNAAPFINPIPSSTALPCSFFLAGYTSTTCTPHSSGGTGLSWWKVCTSWSSFPSSCSASNTQPFPPIGPDVTGGPYANGHAYDLPASIAFQNLPIDASYQSSYTITGSSWSNGTETLTVSGLPGGSSHIIGPFQVSGGNCSTGTSEAYMTGSSVSSGTISYALGANPGSCSGAKMLFPDVRQFDERVFEADSAVQPPAPSGISGNVVAIP